VDIGPSPDAEVDLPTEDVDAEDVDAEGTLPDLPADADADADAGCDDADEDGVCDDEDVCADGDDTSDADEDGVPDACDVCDDGDDAVDADEDGVPDACDVCADGDDTEDADEDGVPDGCDVCEDADDTLDDDTDGVPDACDVCEGFDDAEDIDEDAVPNGCDECSGTGPDVDGDGVDDACDICERGDDALDADADSVPDACDVCDGDDLADADADGVPDACDICDGFDDVADEDRDGVPDQCDVCAGAADALDGDGDGVPDGCDICTGDDSLDVDADGVPDECDICDGDDALNSDDDGVPDACDVCPLDTADDSDSDGVCDSDDICTDGVDGDDADGDGVPDFCDECPADAPLDDDDGDGVCDSDDICEGGSDEDDLDGDGVPDFCDACPADAPLDDDDDDGVCDSDDICDAGDDSADADRDGVPDACDVCEGGADDVDGDGDGVADFCDLCEGGDDTVNSDADSFPDFCDNCSDLDNEDQVDSDGDWVITVEATDLAPEPPPATNLEFGFLTTAEIPIEFEFNYFGSVFSDVTVSANGFLEFTSAGASRCCAGESLGGEGTAGIVAGMWSFLDPAVEPGRVAYETIGVEPERELIVAWESVFVPGSDEVAEFQIILGEAGYVEVHCTTCDTGRNNATQGIQAPGPSLASATIEGRNAEPFVATGAVSFTWASFGGDGVGDVCDVCPLDAPDDDDADTVCNSEDVCPDGDDTQDRDDDGTPDDCDVCPDSPTDDSDFDGVCDDVDVCIGGDDAFDADGDSVPDFCDVCDGFDDIINSDGDSIPDACDNCIEDDNANQLNSDITEVAFVEAIEFSYRESPTTAVSLSDDDTALAPIGFDFPFFGETVSEVQISSNGFISLDSGDDDNRCCTGTVLGGSATRGIIAAFWEDLDPPEGGTITYGTSGVAPEREFVVEFDEIQHFPSASAVSFQIVLGEAGYAEVHCESCPSDSGDHTQGIQSLTSGVFASLEGRSEASFSLVEDAARFTWLYTDDEIGDACDVCPFANPDDEDADEVCDDIDICVGVDDGELFADADTDGVPDLCDVCDGADALDADEDGVPDACDCDDAECGTDATCVESGVAPVCDCDAGFYLAPAGSCEAQPFASVLLFTREADSPAALASTAFEIEVNQVNDEFEFANAYDLGGFDVVVVEIAGGVWDDTVATRVAEWAASGGRLVFSYWNLDTEPVLQTALGLASVTSYFTPQPIFPTAGADPDFLVGVTTPFTAPSDNRGDNGDFLVPAAGGRIVAAAGSPAGQGLFAVTNSDNTVALGILPDEFKTVDADGDGTGDMTEIYQNIFLFIADGI
jgi:hypothetical protein